MECNFANITKIVHQRKSFPGNLQKSVRTAISLEAAVCTFLQNRCSLKFWNIHRKTPVSESLFNANETPAQVFSCECYEIFKNTFFYRTTPVAASVSQNNPGRLLYEVKQYFLIQIFLHWSSYELVACELLNFQLTNKLRKICEANAKTTSHLS